ncbi:MAG TPA: hypothetical protein VFV67_23800 [Actinophytocola sp.]|uniref:hypothetical protein n=1 Tax=Actinophytocola sp. TaxID=1872138 RepID=UPI002DB7673A|nr:hypothetical protein [Actinophytocola sp.]HEU5473682.1 hypothetical protein [Actinophytocola sp.]
MAASVGVVGVVLAGTGSAVAGTEESGSQSCREGSRSGTTTTAGALLFYDICIEAYGANINLYLEDRAKDGRRAEAWLVTGINEYELFEVTGGVDDWDTYWHFDQEATVRVKVCTSDADIDRRCARPV